MRFFKRAGPAVARKEGRNLQFTGVVAPFSPLVPAFKGLKTCGSQVLTRPPVTVQKSSLTLLELITSAKVPAPLLCRRALIAQQLLLDRVRVDVRLDFEQPVAHQADELGSGLQLHVVNVAERGTVVLDHAESGGEVLGGAHTCVSKGNTAVFTKEAAVFSNSAAVFSNSAAVFTSGSASLRLALLPRFPFLPPPGSNPTGAPSAMLSLHGVRS